MVEISLTGDEAAASSSGQRGSKRPSGAEVARGLCQAFLTPEFFESHWEKWPKHRRAAEEGSEANLLPTALTVDDIAAMIASAGPSLKIFRRGSPHEAESIALAYLDGASLIVNQADRFSQTLFDLCSVLAKMHFAHVFAVSYLTPPNSHAVRLHNDDQDVFLLQVWGRKKWIIRNAPKLLPYTEEMLGKDSPVPEALVSEPIMKFDMEPGDVLYIPRGFLHEAETSKEPSLHITVTVPTSDYCWGVQLIKHLMEEMRGGSAASAAAQELRRASLGGGGALHPSACDDAALDARLQEMLSGFASGLSPDSVVSAFERRMERTNDAQAKQLARNLERPQRPYVKEDSRVRWMPGVRVWCEPDGGVAVFSRSEDSRKMHLPIDAPAATIVRALTTRPQPVVSLPCGDRFQRLCVLQLLLELEVLQLFPKLSDEGLSEGV